MRGDYGYSMFISASQNTTLVSLFGADISPVMADCSFSLRACVYANRAESVTNGRDFFPSVTCKEGESETAHLEKLFMIYWFIKK